MFGLPSFPKFIVLIVVICVVYLWSRRNAVQSRSNSGGTQPGPARNAAAKPNSASASAKQKSIEDLVKCPSCGTYIAAGSSCTCGKSRR
jgi:ribosomal protein L32